MVTGYIGESGLTVAGKDAGNNADEHRCDEQQGNALLVVYCFHIGFPPFSNLRCVSPVLENARWLSFRLYYMHL